MFATNWLLASAGARKRERWITLSVRVQLGILRQSPQQDIPKLHRSELARQAQALVSEGIRVVSSALAARGSGAARVAALKTVIAPQFGCCTMAQARPAFGWLWPGREGCLRLS